MYTTDIDVNYWAVLVAAVAVMVVGYIWYSVPVFGRMWMNALGKTEEQIKADYKPTTMLWTYLVAIVTAYVLSHFIELVGADTMARALSTAFWAWLGFTFTVMATNSFYEGRNSKLFWINVLYHLVTVLVMAAILFAWK